MKNKLNRRDFCQKTLFSSIALALPGSTSLLYKYGQEATEAQKGPQIVDTFVHLFDWPFRRLKYADTSQLIQKLKKHQISEAWAGNFEALFHKDIDGTNRRLMEECQRKGSGFFKPVGSVNPTWPDWEEDLRRCDEEYHMAGIRVHPDFQMIDLSSPEFLRLVTLATERNMFVQIAGDLEDPRHHHPLVQVRRASFEPIVEVARAVPKARIQLVHWNRKVGAALLQKLVEQPNIMFDTSRIEGAGELGALINGDSWYGPAEKISSERFLFGSHAPFFAVESALFKLFEHYMTVGQLENVMLKNANKFYNV